jgi:hypothetical protein
MTTRTQDEIRARFDAADDFFGFAVEVLAESMTAETILQINPDADVSEVNPQTTDQVTESARDYLKFAVEKISDHRGLSAERSVIKLREFAWLLGRDDVVAAMDAADYPQYGAPKVKAFADGMGWAFISFVEEWERPLLVRMSSGDPCREDCMDGCGQ